jgi:hypothetical protein
VNSAAPGFCSARGVRVGAALLVLSALENMEGEWPAPEGHASPAPLLAARAGVPPRCPLDHLPDNGLCIPVPRTEHVPLETTTQLALFPGRSADPAAYVSPIPGHAPRQARDGLGLFVSATPGTTVLAMQLEFQIGSTRRLANTSAAGALITLHRVTRNRVERAYLLRYDGVVFPAIPHDVEVGVDAPLGQVRAEPRASGVTLIVRQLRQGIDPDGMPALSLLRDSHSLACDARNVLALTPALAVESR